MNDTRIECPGCGAEIPISEALTAQIRTELAVTLQRQNEERLRRAVQDAAELRRLQEQLAEQRQKTRAAQETELALREEAAALEARRREREKQLERAMLNTAGLYGEMRGIAGTSLAAVPALVLETAALLQDNP